MKENSLRAFIAQRNSVLDQRIRDGRPVDGDTALLIAQNNLLILQLDKLMKK